jgi:hypothetical protein
MAVAPLHGIMRIMREPAVTIRKTIKAREIPASWEVELPGDPEAPVEVIITPLPRRDQRGPKRFLGAGRGLFSSIEEIDAYIRRNRDAWEE